MQQPSWQQQRFKHLNATSHAVQSVRLAVSNFDPPTPPSITPPVVTEAPCLSVSESLKLRSASQESTAGPTASDYTL